jgi:hypothetical protein
MNSRGCIFNNKNMINFTTCIVFTKSNFIYLNINNTLSYFKNLNYTNYIQSNHRLII